MATFDLPEMPANRMSPHLMMGVASPLWAYFGAAAASGVAYWWMTRWARPVNLEAMFGAVPALSAPIEAAAEAAEAMVEAVEAAQTVLLEEIAEFPPVGGESAPISPVLELASMPEPEPTVLEGAPEPVVDAALEPTVEALSEPVLEVAPEPIVEAMPEPVLEAAPEPVIEEPAPAFAETPPKPRAKKSAPPTPAGEA